MKAAAKKRPVIIDVEAEVVTPAGETPRAAPPTVKTAPPPEPSGEPREVQLNWSWYTWLAVGIGVGWLVGYLRAMKRLRLYEEMVAASASETEEVADDAA